MYKELCPQVNEIFRIKANSLSFILIFSNKNTTIFFSFALKIPQADATTMEIMCWTINPTIPGLAYLAHVIENYSLNYNQT